MAKNNAVITTTLLYCCWWHLVLMDSYFELSSLSSMKADHWKKMEIVLYFVSIKIRCCLWVQYFFNTLSDILLSWISLKYCDINFWPPQTHGQIIISKMWTLKKGNHFLLAHSDPSGLLCSREYGKSIGKRFLWFIAFLPLPPLSVHCPIFVYVLKFSTHYSWHHWHCNGQWAKPPSTVRPRHWLATTWQPSPAQ